MSADIRDQIRRTLLVDARPDTVGVDGAADAIMALLAPALREERIKALREAEGLARDADAEHTAKLIGIVDCEGLDTPSEEAATAAARACMAEEIADAIAALIEKETAK